MNQQPMDANTPTSSPGRWKRKAILVGLWLVPGISIMVMTILYIIVMFLCSSNINTADFKIGLALVIFGVCYIALLSFCSEINGRMMAARAQGDQAHLRKVKKRHTAIYFFSQFVVGPLLSGKGFLLLAFLR